MTNRVKNLEKFTKEIVAQIYAWEEIHGPFIYAVSAFCKHLENYTFLCVSYRVRDILIALQNKKRFILKRGILSAIHARRKIQNLNAVLLLLSHYQGK